MTFTQQEQQQYSRHFLLPEVGEKGQIKLKKAHVLIVGAGGLGVPVMQYLAAAGVGKISIIDGDIVEQSNLQRQVIYNTQDIGKSKAIVASEKLKALNPFIEIEAHTLYLDKENAHQFIQVCDLIIDGSDNFQTRYLVNDVCVQHKKPLVYGSIHTFEGQVSVFNVKTAQGFTAHLRDLFPTPPLAELVPDCSEAGVLGVLPGIIGSIMACEALKHLLGIGHLLSNKLLVFDALKMSFTTLNYDSSNEAVVEVLEEYCAPQKVKEISIDEFKTLDPQQYQLIDVRSPQEFAEHNIGGMNIPLSEIEDWINLNKSDKTIILVCLTGIRSKKAAEILLRKEFLDVMSLKGGINN